MKLRPKTELCEWLGINRAANSYLFDAIGELVPFKDACKALGMEDDEGNAEAWGVVRPYTEDEVRTQIGFELSSFAQGLKDEARRRVERARMRLVGLLWVAGLDELSAATVTRSDPKLVDEISAAIAPKRKPAAKRKKRVKPAGNQP